MANQRFFTKEFLQHKLIVGTFGLIALIALGSLYYYYAQTKRPQAVELPAASAAKGDITAAGDVEPLQNPDLSFEASGRIASVSVAVGDRVYPGEVLASLDVSGLSAERAGAEANVKAEQAKLDALKAGPRQTDIAVKQSGVDQATQALANTYAALPSALSDAFAKSSDAVHSAADPLFSNPNTTRPSLAFLTSDQDSKNAAESGRISAGVELTVWQTELAALPASPSESDLKAAIDKALGHASIIRSFEDSLLAALSAAIPTQSFPASSISASQVSVSAARANLNGLITSLTNTKQSLISENLAIGSAQAALQQLTAGAAPQDIRAQEAAVESAQASVAAINAGIANDLIIAPFSGTVGSVSIKAGEVAQPNAPAVTILPDSALEVSVRVTELDVPRIKKGDAADITLDAFGSARVFPGHVSAVDQTPTESGLPAQAGVWSYAVKLSFDSPDPSIRTGMTANATIHPSGE